MSRNLDNLYYRALELGADIVLFGHTHVHINLLHDNIIILNPGSPSFPRGMSRTKTFGLIEIGEKLRQEFCQFLKNYVDKQKQSCYTFIVLTLKQPYEDMG